MQVKSTVAKWYFCFSYSRQIAGTVWGLVLPLFSDSIPVLPLPTQPPSTDGFKNAVRYGHFDWAFVVPMIIEELTDDADALSLIATKLNYLFFTGGALPMQQGIEDTEHPVSVTWKYIRFHPAAQAEFRHHMDDLYELVVRRSSENESAQPVFALFPHLDEYETRDLFSPHPYLPDLWTHRGRRDDLIVLLYGEKFNPVSFEADIAAHPAVCAALMASNQRVEVCLLVESTPGVLLDAVDLESVKQDLIYGIWSTVEAANRKFPAHARISRGKILVLDPDMHMLRAGKGTVQREATLRLYAKQIEALYAEDTMKPAPFSALCRLLVDIAEWPEIQLDTDFFAQGMDSLQLLRLSAAIRSQLGIHVSVAVIYRNPSVMLLAKQIYQGKAAVIEPDHIGNLQQMLQHYQQQVNRLASEFKEASSSYYSPPRHTVMLTGSTGTIVLFLLAQLLADSNITRIYCLNRSVDSGSLQSIRNQQRGISCILDPDRVTLLTIDLTKPSLGLDGRTFQALLEQTTHIIHSAWPVDFNQPVSLFQPSLDGLVNLVSVAYHGKRNPALLFLSSVSAVGSSEGLVPEAVLSNLASPAPMGYGESKYLAERIIDHAASILPNLRLGVARIGLVSGTARGPNGVWTHTEWLPSLVISSRHLNALPSSLGGSRMEIIDWVPIDDLALILAELSESLTLSTNEPGKLSVFHCVNPKTISWDDLIAVIVQESSSTQTPQVIVTFEEWLTRLKASVSAIDEKQDTKDALWQNPGLKLLDFYDQLLTNGHQKRGKTRSGNG
ncbi:hypothetical protein N7490_001747 [Penicillium lividum]|nr:hypothetical protein N7490_001747 [Penicillium lividum]